MEHKYRYRGTGFIVFSTVALFAVSCEKPKLKSESETAESVESAEPAAAESAEGNQTAMDVSETPPGEGKGNTGKTIRIVAEKRTPAAGEGAEGMKKSPPAGTIGNERALDIKYPVGRSLIEFGGKKKVDVTIIGRDAGTVTFVRKSDEKRIDFPIADLSKPDQTFISFLPIQAPPPIKKKVPKPGVLILKENDLEKLRKRARAMRRDLVVNKKKLLIVRGINKRLAVLNGEIQKLEQEIYLYKKSHGIED